MARDMNSAAGTTVNSKNPNSMEAFRYAAGAKAVGPRFGKTTSPKRAKFSKKGAGKILRKRR